MAYFIYKVGMPLCIIISKCLMCTTFARDLIHSWLGDFRTSISLGRCVTHHHAILWVAALMANCLDSCLSLRMRSAVACPDTLRLGIRSNPILSASQLILPTYYSLHRILYPFHDSSQILLAATYYRQGFRVCPDRDRRKGSFAECIKYLQALQYQSPQPCRSNTTSLSTTSPTNAAQTAPVSPADTHLQLTISFVRSTNGGFSRLSRLSRGRSNRR